MTTNALRYRLAHHLVARQVGEEACRRLVALLDSGAPAHEVERELADEIRAQRVTGRAR